MTTDIVTRFLEALKQIEPDVGYMVIVDSPRMEEDFREVPSVGIDGWAYRADFERVLVEFVASEKEGIMTDLNVNGSVKGTPDGIRVYPVRGEYVVADDGGWVPGVYATIDEAVEAAREIGKVRPPIG